MADVTMSEVALSRATLAEMTTEIAAAYVANNHVAPGALPRLLASVHAALDGLGRSPEPDATKPTPRMPIRKTVTEEHIVSLEDGKSYKSLKRHLARHGLTPQAYREKWGLPTDYPMVAPAYARQRSALAKQIGLGAMRRKG